MAFAKAASGQQHLKMKHRFRSEDRTYIFPTVFGFLFGALSFALLIAALGYANNLLHFIVFFLLGIALISMPTTNANVQKVRFQSLHQKPCFANESTELELTLSNESPKTAHDISISVEKIKYGPVQIESGSLETLRVPWTPVKRGRITVPTFSIESSFPYEFLRAWKRIRSKSTVVVFPEKIGNPLFPQALESRIALSNIGVFRELREFTKGSPIRRIDWRASTKHQDLLMRSFEDNEYRHTLEFTWEQVAHLSNVESKLSQLSLWLEIAESKNATFSLHINEYKSGLGFGKPHLFKCLEFLALFPGEQI